MRDMTKYIWLAAVFAASAAQGQVELKLRIANSTVLHMEPIHASLAVINGDGTDLLIGETNGNTRLFFDIEANPGQIVRRTEVPLFRQPAAVPANKSGTLEFNLLPLYQLREPGAYAVIARIHGPGGLVMSSRQFLDIVPGMAVAKLTKTGPDERRYTYQLRTISRDREEHLFLRVDEEAKDLCYGVHDLGSLIRLVDPVLRSDGRGRVHVLHQSAPTRFTHSMFEYDGEPISSKFYSGLVSSVALQTTEDGDIVIAGALPYKGDKSVAAPSVDARRIEEMKNRGPSKPRSERTDESESKPFFRWGLPKETEPAAKR